MEFLDPDAEASIGLMQGIRYVAGRRQGWTRELGERMEENVVQGNDKAMSKDLSCSLGGGLAGEGELEKGSVDSATGIIPRSKPPRTPAPPSRNRLKSTTF